MYTYRTWYEAFVPGILVRVHKYSTRVRVPEYHFVRSTRTGVSRLASRVIRTTYVYVLRSTCNLEALRYRSCTVYVLRTLEYSYCSTKYPSNTTPTVGFNTWLQQIFQSTSTYKRYLIFPIQKAMYTAIRTRYQY
jgi:hypothetical protein